jgi:ATP-binding cassette subfamily B protein
MTQRKREAGSKTFAKVLRYNAGHWKKQPVRITTLFAGFMAATLCDLFMPLYAGRIVDAVARGSAGDPAIWDAAVNAFLMLLLLGLAGIVIRQFSFMGIITLTLKQMSEVAQETFHRVQRFSADWHASTFAGSTVRKITRGMWAIDVLNDTILIMIFPTFVMLVGMTVVLATFWPVMGVVVGLGSLLVIGLIVTLSTYWIAPAASLANFWDTRLGGAFADAISCNAVVKGFGAEEREEGRIAQVFGKWTSRTRRVWTRGTANGTIQAGVLLFFRAAIIGTALWLWAEGLAAAGDIAFVVTSFFVLQGYLRDIGMHFRNLQRSINDMEELVEIHAQPFGVADRRHAKGIEITEGRVVFENVDFHYGNHTDALYRDFSVVIEAGERVGLVGHSGSGKTTFVKLIQRLHDVTGGRILIDGQDISQFTQASLRQQIAIVQQEPILFHRSLADNIAYGRPGASRAEIERAARLANAYEFIEDLPKGFETLVGERGVKLSGGERQRVAIARAFLADAPILIMDEATSSLDSESEALVQKAMARLMEGRTTIVIAHRLSTVRALDRLLVFSEGEVVEEGTHEALVNKQGGIYRRLFERQALELTQGLAVA